MLRRRLFLNLIPFVVTLVAVGVYAIILISNLAKNVDVSVMDNYRSATAAQTMNVALSRMETGLHLAMDGETAASLAFFNENKGIFERNLAEQSKNSALQLEPTLVAQLKTNYQSFREAGQSIISLDQKREQRRLFEKDAVPRIMAINLLLEKIRNLNHSNILATSQNIQRSTRHFTGLMILGLAVAFLIAVFASFHLSKAILKPILLLTSATREVGQGNLDQIVPVLSQDELGELATSFNKMSAQIKAYRQSTTEKIIRLHSTMESALASFPDPIFVLDRAGHIELENPAAQSLSARLALRDNLPPKLAATAQEVLETGKDFLPHDFKEVLSYRVNGNEQSFLPRVHTMRGDDNQPVGVAVVLHDVTRFRLMDDVKTNLVATVSHELKTPLTSVRMVLHLLLEKTLGPLNGKQTELLQTARKDSERLLLILNDLLDLARLEAGNPELNRESTAPATLVQSISDEVQRNIQAQGLKLTCSAQPHLPAVLVDRQRIGHVFHNFIINAIKHSPAGGEIQVRAFQTNDGNVQFSVKDQGAGVPEEYQNRIFDRFFRIPGQTKTGAGLGLSIAREIVVAHGGRIGVHSLPGRGSEFYMVLPGLEPVPGV